MVQEEGLREPHTYMGLLRAIGAGYTQVNDIGQRTGLHETLLTRLAPPVSLHSTMDER